MSLFFNRFTYIAFLLISIPFGSVGAGKSDMQYGTSSLPIDQIITQLQQKHEVTIFYKPDWFLEESINPDILKKPLRDALSELIRGNDLEIVDLGNIILFIPSGRNQPQLADARDHIKVIGSPQEYGRYSRAGIQGKITDGATGEPLIGAVVFEPVSSRGVTTNLEGEFSLELAVGDHRLRISYVGYEDTYHDIRLISNGEAVFELFSKVSQLQEVTVTARRAMENVLRTQMSVITIDAKSIKELPQTFGERDIVRSITLLPGIQTIGEFGTGFNVRGGSADQNLILIENVPLFNSSHLFGLISVVNPDMVSDVTLMKAGIPARYGERASSVMDVRLGNGDQHNRTRLTGGIGIINSRLLFQMPVIKEKWNISLGARSSYSDWLLRRIPDEDLMNSNAGFYDITFHSTAALNKNNHLTLFGYHSYDRFGFSNDNQQDYGNTMASLRWNSFFTPRLSSTFLAGWSYYFFNITEKPQFRSYSHFNVFSDIDYRMLKWFLTWHPYENHVVEYGINVIGYKVDPGHKKPFGAESIINPEQIQREQAWEISGFISDDIKVSERMSVDIGVRFTQYLQLGSGTVYSYQDGFPRRSEYITDSVTYERGDILSSYNGLEPRLGMRYQLDESSSAKLSYNRSNQYINLISNTSIMSPTDLWKLSDIHLKPLTSDQYAAGYFRNFSDNTIETSIEAYYKTIHNAIEYKSGAELVMNPTMETDLVNAKGYNYGLEIYVNKNSGRLTGWTSYTFSASMRRTDSQFPSDQINKNTWFPTNYDRPHNMVANMNYHISRRWRLGATFTYSTGRPVTLPESTYLYGSNFLVYFSDRNKYRLPDYHRLDVSISMGENHRLNQRGKGFWTFTIMNLYGRKNPYSVFYKKEPSTAGSFRSFNLYQLYIIGTPMPTLTYNFSF
jgi:hypothetical protein